MAADGEAVRQRARRELSATETALCGGTAGVASRLAIAPLDVIKIRLQTQPHADAFNRPLPVKYRGVVDAFAKILREEGLLAFWKGNGMALLLYMSYGAFQFGTYYEMKKLYGGYSRHRPWMTGSLSFLSGAVAGAVGTTATYPFDLLRTRFAVRRERRVPLGLWGTVRTIAVTEGVAGFYRGLTPAVLQILPYTGLMYYSYELAKAAIRSAGATGTALAGSGWAGRDVEKLVCGGIAGLVSKTGTMPFDVVRKRLQLSHGHAHVPTPVYAVGPVVHFQGIRDCVVRTYRTEGFRGFYRGLWPALLKTAPASAVTFLVFDKSRELLVRVRP